MERLAYSVVEAARLAGISRATMFVLIQRGEIRTLKIGRRRLISQRSLEAFIRKSEARTAKLAA